MDAYSPTAYFSGAMVFMWLIIKLVNYEQEKEEKTEEQAEQKEEREAWLDAEE